MIAVDYGGGIQVPGIRFLHKYLLCAKSLLKTGRLFLKDEW
ncbi:conserved hypothetical protein [delta proteobacterium NaphS2]|nr:conserved hypothetical protein [delta proteobacterium NaphS2]